MVKNTDFQEELKEKVKEGVKPSQLKHSLSTPVKNVKGEKENCAHEPAIKQLETQKEQLLKINQAAISQNEQLVQVIEKLKEEKGKLEESLLEKRLELSNTPLNNATNSAELNQLKEKLLFYQRLNQTKNCLLISLLIALGLVLLLK